MKTCVVYYSHSGNVKFYAEKCAAALNAPLFELEPVTPLKGTGFCSMMKGGGQAVTGQKPALKEMPDLAEFDRVILGVPVWAGRCAAPVWTLLSSGALRDKTVCLMTLSGGGNDQKAAQQVAASGKTLAHRVALLDRAVKGSAGNEEKLTAFLEKIREQ